MSNKRRGMDSEREGRKLLESEGYTVIPAKGSLGCFDAIAINKEHMRLIQFKRVKGKYYSFKQEINKIKEFNNHPKNTIKELWIRLDRMQGRKKQWKKQTIN